MSEHKDNELGQARVDSVVSIAKGIVGAIPVGGALFAEIIGMAIPNQRLDRVVAVLMELDQRLNSVEREELRSNKYALDLFEDGMIQAARSLTGARNRYIAIFIQGCSGVEEDMYGVKKKLFFILQELTDIDIEILAAMESGKNSSHEYRLRPRILTHGQYRSLSEPEKREYDARQEAWGLHMATLERNGLVYPEREKPNIENPLGHIDRDTGLPKIIWYRVSDLGRVFLRSIGKDVRDRS